MKAEVNKSLCISCGTCVSMCATCFEFGDDGKAQFIKNVENCECDLSEVADSCPVQAITVN